MKNCKYFITPEINKCFRCSKNGLIEMNTHNICFDSEIRKITMLMDIAAAKVLNNPGKLSL